MLTIKVNTKEYDSACSHGCAYGLVRGKPGMYAYAELGQEEEHLPKNDKQWKEERRFFRNSEVFFALTPENLEEGIYEDETYRGGVEIYT
jgi:hypothetical protein